MENTSSYGLKIILTASVTFPVGLVLSQFADDADSLDIPSLQIADSAMGSNGDLIVWSKANPIKPKISLVAGGTDDVNMSILFEANRVGRGKIGARDVITMVAMFPDGFVATFKNGIITDGSPALSAASTGRLKTKEYSFTFENLSFI